MSKSWVARTLEALGRLHMLLSAGEKPCDDSGTGDSSEVARSPVVRDVLGYPLLRKINPLRRKHRAR